MISEVLTAASAVERWAARPRRGRSCVVLDLDCCLVLPETRMRAALAELAADGLPELRDPATWELLPGLHHRGWAAFVEHHGLDLVHKRAWDVVEKSLRRLLSWEMSALASDTLAPGARQFVRELWDRDVEPLLLTGRPEWMRAATQDALGQLGIPLAVRCADRSAGSTAAGKVATLRQLGVTVLGAVDDEIENVEAMQRAFPDALVLHHSPCGFSRDPRAHGAALDGFELDSALAAV